MKCIWIIAPMKSCLVSQRLGTTVLNIFFRWNVFFLWLNTLILSQLWRPMVNESFYCPLCISVVFLPESILHCFRYVNEVFFFFFFFQQSRFISVEHPDIIKRNNLRSYTQWKKPITQTCLLHEFSLENQAECLGWCILRWTNIKTDGMSLCLYSNTNG